MLNWEGVAQQQPKLPINPVSQRLREVDAQAHHDCISQIERLTMATANLRIAIDKQARQNQALLQRVNSNIGLNSAVLQVGRNNPQVQRLKLQNYKLQKQLEQQYVQPDNFFKLQTRPRRFEEEKKKEDLIKLLRKQLEIVRTECLKAGEKGANYLDVQRYERLSKQNETLRDFVKNRTGKRPGDLPPSVQRIIGAQSPIMSRQTPDLPEIAALSKANAQLQMKIDQFNQQQQLLLYEIQLRQLSYQQARELNNQLRQQYSIVTSPQVLRNNPEAYDPLVARIQRLEVECANLRAALQQQSTVESEISHRLRVMNQAYEVNAQVAAIQNPPILLQQLLEQRKAQIVENSSILATNPLTIPPNAVQTTMTQQAQLRGPPLHMVVPPLEPVPNRLGLLMQQQMNRNVAQSQYIPPEQSYTYQQYVQPQTRQPSIEQNIINNQIISANPQQYAQQYSQQYAPQTPIQQPIVQDTMWISDMPQNVYNPPPRTMPRQIIHTEYQAQPSSTMFMQPNQPTDMMYQRPVAQSEVNQRRFISTPSAVVQDTMMIQPAVSSITSANIAQQPVVVGPPIAPVSRRNFNIYDMFENEAGHR